MSNVLDCSNWSGPLSANQVETLYRQGYRLGIVQALDKARFPGSVTRQQIQALHDGGLAVDVYAFPFYVNGAEDVQRRLDEVDGLYDKVRMVWLDVEENDPSSRSWSANQRLGMVGRWLELADQYQGRSHRPCGLYTAWWYWRDYLGWGSKRGDRSGFEWRHLWDAQYDGIPDVGTFVPYAGWAACDIKQYQGDTSIAGIPKVDLDVAAPWEWDAILAYLEPFPAPEPDDGYPVALRALADLGDWGGDTLHTVVQTLLGELQRANVRKSVLRGQVGQIEAVRARLVDYRERHVGPRP